MDSNCSFAPETSGLGQSEPPARAPGRASRVRARRPETSARPRRLDTLAEALRAAGSPSRGRTVPGRPGSAAGGRGAGRRRRPNWPPWLRGCGAPREQGRGRGSEGHGAGRGPRSGDLGAHWGARGRGQEDEEEEKGTVRLAGEGANKTARPKQKSSWARGGERAPKDPFDCWEVSARERSYPRGGGLGEVLGGVSDWQLGSVFQTRKKKNQTQLPCPLGRFLSHFSPAGSCCLLGPPGIGRVKIL